jgi:hypothetical protein
MIRVVALFSALWSVFVPSARSEETAKLWDADELHGYVSSEPSNHISPQKVSVSGETFYHSSCLPKQQTRKRRAPKQVSFGSSMIFDYETPEYYTDEACFRKRMQEIRSELQTQRAKRMRVRTLLLCFLGIVGWSVFRHVYKSSL